MIGHIAWLTGIRDEDEPVTPEQLLDGFDVSRAAERFPDLVQIRWK